jgi:hypothetical protein
VEPDKHILSADFFITMKYSALGSVVARAA